MKYPDRMARRGGGSRPFHTAIATTFSIEFAALEEVMLPQLMASGATNLLTVADERMASMSLSDGSQLPMQLGRDYELFSPQAADGLFHPKILLQVGRKAGRLFVGSANITAAGLAGNAETVLELECQDEPGPEQEVIRSAWRYVSDLVPREPSAARDALDWAADRATWLMGPVSDTPQHLEDGTAIAFLAKGGLTGIGSRFVELVGADTIQRLVVASPYWDGQLVALGDVVRRLRPTSTVILLDADGHEFPLDAPLPEPIEFKAFPSRLAGRFKHAKFLVASTEAHDHVLVGSANCTVAALGREGFAGSNHEACIYRRLPRDRALEALGLVDCIEAEAVDLDDIDRKEPSPAIPLEDIAARRPGSFELDGSLLTWTPPSSISGTGRILMLDAGGCRIGEVDFAMEGQRDVRLSLPLSFDRPERTSFALVSQGEWISARAHVTHRGLLRLRRREVATGSVARAVAAFDAGEDFDLWMHGAFEELARADLTDRPTPSISPVRSRQDRSEGAPDAPRELSYDEFMETRSLDARSGEQRESSLAGTHSDSVRSFLNMLVGRFDTPSEEDNAWLDLQDEDGEEKLEAETQQAEQREPSRADDERVNETQVDARQFEKMVRLYASTVTSMEEPLGANDVLRVRFWLMMLLHKARHPGLPNGLETSSEEQGWPRMAVRVIAAFFCGKRPPVTRLMIAREYTEMPVDFLECWATVLWTIDAIGALLSGSVRHRQFLIFVNRARSDVARLLGLTPTEMASDTFKDLQVALSRTLGARLRLPTLHQTTGVGS